MLPDMMSSISELLSKRPSSATTRSSGCSTPSQHEPGNTPQISLSSVMSRPNPAPSVRRSATSSACHPDGGDGSGGSGAAVAAASSAAATAAFARKRARIASTAGSINAPGSQGPRLTYARG